MANVMAEQCTLECLFYFILEYKCLMGFPAGSVVKNSPANAGSAGSIPGSERSSGKGNDSACHSSCLGNLTDKGTWWAAAPGVAKERRLTTKQQRN